MSKLKGFYTGDEIVHLQDEGSKPIIEGFIYEMDHVMLVGKEKANKSTLALQMMCAITSGEPLFGQFEVPTTRDVAYLQAEGKVTNTGKNLANMTKVIPADKSKMGFINEPAIQLNTMEGLTRVKAKLDAWRRPDLLIIDPLYQSMGGKIDEQEPSSRMTANLRHLSEYYQCSIMLIHHAHRARRTETGKVIDEGDDSVFGSFVWKAFPDTVLLIQKTQGHKTFRKLSCETQRMGNVFPELELTLIEPEPFYLQIRDNHPIDEIVLFALKGKPATINELVALTNKSRQHISNALYRLQHKGTIQPANVGQKPVVWKFL